MTGINELTLNTASMKVIVQHYFDHVLFAQGQRYTVADVQPSTKGYSGDFVIQFEKKAVVPEMAEPRLIPPDAFRWAPWDLQSTTDPRELAILARSRLEEQQGHAK